MEKVVISDIKKRRFFFTLVGAPILSISALLVFRAMMPQHYLDFKRNLELLHVAMQKFPTQKETITIVPKTIAHAAGEIRGLAYSNSLEALDSSYGRGYRHMEMDFSWTTDGNLVLLHDWNLASEMFGCEPRPYSVVM